jgi:hypothetical protein
MLPKYPVALYEKPEMYNDQVILGVTGVPFLLDQIL